MIIKLKQTRYGGDDLRENAHWLATDEYNHTGTGRTAEESIGDLILSHRLMINISTDIQFGMVTKEYKLEINND